jgi:S-disulfanyl-L-cysteine oxidoreductase SoxD
MNHYVLKSLTLLTILAILFACTTIAQEGSAPGILQGVYTAEQAQRGATTFRDICRNCHIPRDFRSILQQSENAEALISDYYDLIRMTMPEDSPGGLSEETYLDVMAYLLSINGFSSSD